ncbi:serine/threonine-protein phosphatase [Streptomyces lunaelactis]|uniref:PP2C family protein-serine/threonine phosphatase n=1 Tax=Streptomyces lunaelactis TaxID=1535768 RepID=UPI0015859527|nr:PP2C family protein-serine/threonine phosphatase [Streptomyces lunaelactis]NUK25618.1 serine/threonine-protein phosphatase [Streptomyces lunaelactis]NUK36921.1 serine/threonine-protein phosphatase [Streptomyces lunaelactis]NUK43548.1 serine/threonine-protein phosphatase [Streptomyces lunaelactis]NUK53237.1 serine/threonine-protein phosphatase [Streptomyces lunaelactis]NUK64894.1 serine/threonine-protein phosphatase [Streptomyces lunaelactis]
MLDIPLLVRVHVDALIAAQNDMGVCDAIERNEPVGKPTAMSAPHLPKVAGIDSAVPTPAQTSSPMPAFPAAPAPPGAVIQDRLAGWVSDLTTLHELTERLARTGSLDEALNELLRAGAALVGARRGMVVLEPPPGTSRANDCFDEGRGPALTKRLGFTHAELGHIETVPRSAIAYGRILDGRLPDGQPGPAGQPEAVADGDLLGDKTLDPRYREVAVRLGYAASYTLPLASTAAGTLGAAVWMYDEPAAPVERQCHLVGLYMRYATEHLDRLLELEHARATVATVAEELLPSRLPRVPGVQLAARHRTGPRGGGDWYDALPLPEGALGLAVGSVSGAGPSALAAMGRLRASLRAYAVMEGEDPVAVLSDLELLLRLTEPARTATALFAYAEPARRKIVLAGAGHTPPLVVGERRTEFVETSLSAPLGMLACWEAPSVELSPEPGETVLLYTDGLLRRTGDPMDRAFARLHAAAASVPMPARDDPAAIADHVLRTVLPEGLDEADGGEDVVLLAARFD